jgi:hypothetical protein
MKLALALVAVAFTAALLPSSRAQQREDGVFVGTIGSSAVVMTLNSYGDTDAFGYYYYRRVGRDIELSGSKRGTTWTLTERAGKVGEPDRATLSFSLTPGRVTGAWKDAKSGRSLPVTLRAVTPSDLTALKLGGAQSNTWARGNPYEALRFDAPFKVSSTQTLAGKRAQWVTEPKSGVRLPRLPGESAAVNDALQLEHLKAANAALSCILDDYEHSAKLELYSGRLVSVSATTGFYCGGAHPDNSNDNFTVDLQSVRTLEIEDLYRFTGVKRETNPERDGFEAYAQARAATVRKLILAQDGTLLKGLDPSCKEVYDDNSALTYFTWYLTPRGLVVQSSLPHVAAACEKDYLLPYAALRAYLAPNSPLR